MQLLRSELNRVDRDDFCLCHRLDSALCYGLQCKMHFDSDLPVSGSTVALNHSRLKIPTLLSLCGTIGHRIGLSRWWYMYSIALDRIEWTQLLAPYGQCRLFDFSFAVAANRDPPVTCICVPYLWCGDSTTIIVDRRVWHESVLIHGAPVCSRMCTTLHPR